MGNYKLKLKCSNQFLHCSHVLLLSHWLQLHKRFTSISRSQVKKPVESYSDSLVMKSQRLQEILLLSVLERRVLDNLEKNLLTKDQASIELLMDSWLKVEISLPETVLEENQSTEINSLMRTSTSSTPSHTFFQWQMPDQTQMDLNSSLHSLLLHG